MALALDTGHALYGNIISCIGVEGGALVDLKTARTFTPHADTSFGTGTWGEHFRSVTGGYTSKGVAFTPSIADSTTTTPNQTTLFIFNNITSGSNISKLSATSGGSNHHSIVVKTSDGFARGALANATGNPVSTSTVVGVGEVALAITRTGETASAIFVDGVEEGTAGRLGYNSGDTTNYLLGWSGQGSVGADLVWYVKFNKVLTATELLGLSNSLGASNTFALVSSGGADTTAPVITLTGASTINQTVGGSWTDPGYSATDDTDGDITGSVVVAGDTVDPATIGTYVITYNVDDAASNSATEVTRTVNIEPAVTDITFSGTIPDQAFTVGDTVDVDLSGYFSGTETPFTYASSGTSLSGSGLTINASTGHLEGTATEATIANTSITGTDDNSEVDTSNTFDITTTAASITGVRGDEIPTTGTNGPSVLAQYVTLPNDAAVLFGINVTVQPSVGTLTMYDDGSFIYNAVVGTNDSFTYEWYRDGVLQDTVSQLIQVGVTSTFNIEATNIPDGDYETMFYDQDTEAYLPKQTLTYASGVASVILGVDVGTRVWAFTPPTSLLLKDTTGFSDTGDTV